jgi:hypothetical protein
LQATPSESMQKFGNRENCVTLILNLMIRGPLETLNQVQHDITLIKRKLQMHLLLDTYVDGVYNCSIADTE